MDPKNLLYSGIPEKNFLGPPLNYGLMEESLTIIDNGEAYMHMEKMAAANPQKIFLL